MGLPNWAYTLINATEKERLALKGAILDGVSYFKAKWQKITNEDPPKYRLLYKDKEALALVQQLKSRSDFEEIGFCTLVPYIKVQGPKNHLDVVWEHKLAHPALLLAHKRLPVLIITGPNIMFDDSILNHIPANEMNIPTGGISG